MKAHWFYYLVKFTGWIGLKLFFGKVKLVGKEKVPQDGALLFTPNHQGAFMDAMLTGIFNRKPLSFLTRSDVFNKWSTPILNSLNMMPIYRIRDGIGSLSQNDAVFETCFKMLSEERSILVFPEGNHNIEYPLRPLSKGTARLALDARDKIGPSTKIYIIPTGINYFSHKRPLAKVILTFGDPITLEDYMPLYQEHKQKAYNQLRADLAEAMKTTLIIPEEDENYEQKRDWIFQPKHESLSFEKLRKMGTGNHFESRKTGEKNLFIRMLIGFFSLFNYPALLGLRKVLSGIKDKVFYVSIKYLLGGILHLLWWAVLYTLGALSIGWEAGLLFIATGVVTMYARQNLIRF